MRASIPQIMQRDSRQPARAKSLTVEWTIAEDDRAWDLARTATPAAPAPTRHWDRRWWIAAAVALLFLLAAGGWLWHQAHAGLSRIEGEVQAAVEADHWRAGRDSRPDAKQASVRQDIAAMEQLPEVAQVQLLDLGEEWALVQVTTTQGELSLRQTRLYRRDIDHGDVNGWYAAAPGAAAWGAARTLETTRFIFHYYALDAEAVAEAAAKLDALYPDLAASYPFDPIRGGKRRIWVSPEYSLLAGAFDRTPDASLEITSPALYLAPSELGEGDILAQAVLLELLDDLADHSLEPYLRSGAYDDQTRARVHDLLESLRLWQLWSTELPLAALHKPTIQWLYHDVYHYHDVYQDVQGERVLPAFDAKLCSLHQLWGSAPYAIQIPLFCGDPQQLTRYEVGRYLPDALPRSLADIPLFVMTMPDEPARGLVEAERVGLATLFDYAAATYGRRSLSALIVNAASHSSWGTLIPTTFGVPISDFETGWQAHLRNYSVGEIIAEESIAEDHRAHP